MATNLQGSFYTSEAFTVRMTKGASTADWVVAAGTTYMTADEALAAWGAAISSIHVKVGYNINASSHTATVYIETGGSTFDVTWSHAGDGTRMRDFLGEVGDLSGEPDGYMFDNPLAVAWFPSYDMRNLQTSVEPWDKQRMMTGSGAISTNNPHHNTDSELHYTARADFWFGYDVGTGYAFYEALRDFIEGLLEYGQPFVITTDDDQYTCRLANPKQLELVPEPVDNIQRGDLYKVSLNLTVVD